MRRLRRKGCKERSRMKYWRSWKQGRNRSSVYDPLSNIFYYFIGEGQKGTIIFTFFSTNFLSPTMQQIKINIMTEH